MINLRPRSGLCNRLRAMNGAYWLARRLGCRLNVFWRVDDSMNTRFSELFEVPEDMSLIEMKPESYFSRGLFSWLNPFASPVDDRVRFVRRVVASKGWGPWALTEYAEFYDAAVDLMLLAGCSRLYGSYYSSFSEVAAAIGNVPFVQLRGSAVES